MSDAPPDYRPSILDTSNIKTLHRYRRLLTEEQRELLSIVRLREAKSLYLQRQAAKENYRLRTQPDANVRWSQLARLGIALMSTWERRWQYVYCGHGNRVNKRGLCHIYRYCLTCNHAFRAKPIIEEFTGDASFYGRVPAAVENCGSPSVDQTGFTVKTNNRRTNEKIPEIIQAEHRKSAESAGHGGAGGASY